MLMDRRDFLKLGVGALFAAGTGCATFRASWGALDLLAARETPGIG